MSTKETDPQGNPLAVDTYLRQNLKRDAAPDAPERQRESGWIGVEEWKRVVPAARCRECGEVTWKLSLSGGPEKLLDSPRRGPVHRDGCSKPPGKLDLRYR